MIIMLCIFLSHSLFSRPKNRASALTFLSCSTGHQAAPHHLPHLQEDRAQLQEAALRCRTTGDDGGGRKTRFCSKLDNSSYRRRNLPKLHPQVRLDLPKLPEPPFHGGVASGSGWNSNPVAPKTSIRRNRGLRLQFLRRTRSSPVSGFFPANPTGLR
ncbi:uncharacterized protein LOC112182024 isoform X2 [Rosa chinensis]|uniref:uncharacterized protein LOC112182024 isoform X2 n=1 Tax=Rosa chinensis TaxID=74649 RepID=UPI001AD8EA38|nr:uncharacterized protein LOC112182024 isoform X2 [Rosa chinensis]